MHRKVHHQVECRTVHSSRWAAYTFNLRDTKYVTQVDLQRRVSTTSVAQRASPSEPPPTAAASAYSLQPTWRIHTQVPTWRIVVKYLALVSLSLLVTLKVSRLFICTHQHTWGTTESVRFKCTVISLKVPWQWTLLLQPWSLQQTGDRGLEEWSCYGVNCEGFMQTVGETYKGKFLDTRHDNKVCVKIF